MGVLGTASLPSSQTICSPGCECCELAWGQSRAAVPVHPQEHPALVGPMCQHSQGLLSWSIVPWGSQRLLCWLCKCPARAGTLLCLSWDAGGCCRRSHGPSTALQGRVHTVGRAPHSLPGCGNRPDQFPRALASGSGLSAACQPHAALSFGLELPARLDYLRPKHPLLVLCCRPQPHCPSGGTSTRAAPALSELGKENRSECILLHRTDCPKEPSLWDSPSSSHSRPTKCPEKFHSLALPWQKCPPSSAAPQGRAT